MQFPYFNAQIPSLVPANLAEIIASLIKRFFSKQIQEKISQRLIPMPFELPKSNIITITDAATDVRSKPPVNTTPVRAYDITQLLFVLDPFFLFVSFYSLLLIYQICNKRLS
jgi:hypothetical protein